MNYYRIVKIYDFPLIDGTVQDISVDFKIGKKSKSIFFKMEGDLLKLAKLKRIKEFEATKVPYLFALSDKGEKLTLYGVSYAFEIAIFGNMRFLQNSFLVGGHITDIEQLKANRITSIVSEEGKKYWLNIMDEEFEQKRLRISLIYKKYIYLWNEQTYCEKIYSGKAKIIVNGFDSTFNELNRFFIYFCELFFLLYGVYPNYDHFVIESDDAQKYKYWTYPTIFKEDVKKKEIIEGIQIGTLDYQKAMKNFIQFRQTSGLIFDVLIRSIYIITFEEDYPLRLVQCLDGFMVYSGLAFYEYGKFDSNAFTKLTAEYKDNLEYTFRKDVVIKSIKYVSEAIGLFSNSRERDSFANKIYNHRNLFSHVKHNGIRLVGKENIEAAKKLFTIIRYLIIQFCVDDHYFDWLKNKNEANDT